MKSKDNDAIALSRDHVFADFVALGVYYSKDTFLHKKKPWQGNGFIYVLVFFKS